MKATIVIPARWGSTRLVGKPLVRIAGRTLLDRMIDIGRRASRDMAVDILVATDDRRIVRHAEELGCAAVMTPATLSSGSDRVLAAMDTIGSTADSVVNLQGDTPFVPIETVTGIMSALEQIAFGCVTPVVTLDWPALDALRDRKRVTPFSGTTCVCDERGRALWFSKAVLPAIRDESSLRTQSSRSPVRQHIGIYGYTLPALRQFCASPPSPLERLEGLEQLRSLELGIPVMTINVATPLIQMGGVDTADDVALAERLIDRYGDPYGGNT